MVAIDNLVDFIQCCVVSEAASNQLFLISDCDDISLPRLITLIRGSLNLPTRLFAFPLFLLKFLSSLLGKSQELAKLTNSIQLNTDKANKQLSWKPLNNVEDAITKTVKDYLESK